MRLDRKNTYFRFINYGIIIILVFSLLFNIFLLVENKLNSGTIYKDYSIYSKIDDDYYDQTDVTKVLIIGLDTFNQKDEASYVNDMLADFIVLLIIDRYNKTIQPIHINRDSMVNYDVLSVNGKKYRTDFGQIALSHTYGSGKIDSLNNTKNCISDLFYGLTIDYSFSLTMNCIKSINDLVGPVPVYVEDDFSSIDPTIIQYQDIYLNGDQAISFVRSRSQMNDSTNLVRMKRQRVYLKSLFNEFKNAYSLDKDIINKIAKILDKDLVSNSTIYDINNLANDIIDFELKESLELKGENVVNHYMEYYLDEDYLKDICLTYLYKKIK